jgi:hypothetical protein
LLSWWYATIAHSLNSLKNVLIFLFLGVNRALEKSHIVDGTKLQVRKHVPPKRYPNKALIKGLSEKTSEDGLSNFLEAKTKKDVVMVESDCCIPPTQQFSSYFMVKTSYISMK